MLDIHTHYDVEVLDGPALTESLRHGVTTVMLGSCSLSTVHVDGVDAGDLFGRVEAIPREHVIERRRPRTRRGPRAEEYVGALESRPLGPNVAAFIGHSDMRAATMGLDRATRKDERPTPARAGADGADARPRRSTPASSACPPSSCSSTSSTATSAAPAPCRRRTPSRASCAGCKSLLRRPGRVLQAGPDIQNPLNLGSQVAQSLGVVPQPAQDQPAVGRRRQGEPVRGPR